jgi:hypothetical protein
VLATVLDAVDIGYRVIVVCDAICFRRRPRNADAALSHPVYGADRDRGRRDGPRPLGMIRRTLQDSRFFARARSASKDRPYRKRGPDAVARHGQPKEWPFSDPPPICIRRKSLRPDRRRRRENPRSSLCVDAPCLPEGWRVACLKSEDARVWPAESHLPAASRDTEGFVDA